MYTNYYVTEKMMFYDMKLFFYGPTESTTMLHIALVQDMTPGSFIPTRLEQDIVYQVNAN